MIQAGYPPKMLQEIMGHASITTTLDLYGHLYPGEMDRYADVHHHPRPPRRGDTCMCRTPLNALE